MTQDNTGYVYNKNYYGSPYCTCQRCPCCGKIVAPSIGVKPWTEPWITYSTPEFTITTTDHTIQGKSNLP